jgi:hypothetical protein
VSDDDAYLLTEPNRHDHRTSEEYERRGNELDYERQEQRLHHPSIAHQARMAIISLERIMPAALDETTERNILVPGNTVPITEALDAAIAYARGILNDNVADARRLGRPRRSS